MRTTLRTLLLLALLGGGVIGWIVARHHEQVRLQADSDRLRAGLTRAGASAAPSSEPTSAAPAGDQRELLRLRGEVAALNREIEEAERQLAAYRPALRSRPAARAGDSSAGETPPKPELTPAQKAQNELIDSLLKHPLMREAGRIAGQLKEFRRTNPSALPGRLQDLSLGELDAAFELMRTDPVTAEEAGFTLVARSRQAEATADGQWFRAYVRADGAVCLAGPTRDPDWPAWERAHVHFAREAAAVHP